MKCTGEHCDRAKDCALYIGNVTDSEAHQVENLALCGRGTASEGLLEYTWNCGKDGNYALFAPIKTKTLVVDLTNTIYLAEVVPTKNDPNILTLTGDKEDMTNQALAAVFQWFINNYKENEPNEAFEVRFPNKPYVLKMVKEDDNE